MPDEIKPSSGGEAPPDGATPKPPVPTTQTPATPIIQQGAPQTPVTPTTEPKRHRLGVEDDIPDDADLLELPRRALDSRLARHTKSQLQQRFGTSDFDEIKGKLDRLT